LICLKEVEPPLSIGLFGGWGSGKSTFMQLLEEEIDALTRRIRTVAGAKGASNISKKSKRVAPPFIRNVVQVRFNAWQFADANLWASLTAEFFDQLRAGGYAQSGKANYMRLVERVNVHVHALASAAASARQTLRASEEVLWTAQKERDQAVAQVEKTPGRVLKQTLVDAVTKSFEDHKADLVEMGHRTYHDDPVKDIDDFLDLSKRLQTSRGQFAALVQFVRARDWRAFLAVAGFAVAGIAIVLGGSMIWKGAPWNEAFTLNFLAFIAGLGAVARAVLPGVKIIGNLIESTSSFAANLDDTLEEGIRTVAKAEEKLQRAAAETEARRGAAERAAKTLARYVDPGAIANPPRLLRFMLEDDPDTRALEKEIGLISRVRRLFQAVDQIVNEEKKKGEGAATEDQKRDPDVPDRIVIYIDDLDRCTPAQVYAVLQAIHLLLAFKLFVVVVGVDVAWVQEVLASELPSTQGPRAQGEAMLASRYLEKIFQLPFWLRGLSSEGEGGGSYGRFVRSLLSPNLIPPSRHLGDGGLTESGQTPDADSGLVGGHTPVDNGKIAKPSEDVNAEESRPKTSDDPVIDEAVRMVQLTKGEVDFLASEAIGNLSGREPRTVKRFVNIYRIIRARLDNLDRSLFLGDSATPPDYPVVALLIAIEAGQVAHDFYDELSSVVRNEPIGKGLDPRICAALKEAQRIRNGQAITREKCLYWAKTVQRYSFNKYDDRAELEGQMMSADLRDHAPLAT
jgi:hypothetical protein